MSTALGLTTREAAEELRLQPLTVARLAREGRIPARKIGNEWRFSRKALEAWLSGDQRDCQEGET